ncbi:MAG: phosphomannomutase/phosphoglucomutase [Acidimicrobiia bacterium]
MDLSNIVKAYDVRGVVPTELDASITRRLGAAFAAFAGGDRIIVGHDCRVSSPDLRDALIDGIISQGVDVLAIGEVPTDLLYYASGTRALPGVVITASHNPGQYNGLKFCGPGAAPIGQDTGLAEIRSLAERGLEPAATRGTVASADLRDGYIDHVTDATGASAIGQLRVVIDGGNGMAGAVLPQVFARINAEMIPLYLEPDGTFPNHPADPLRPENLADLVDLVQSEAADLGVAFDGDADRAFFIDDQAVPMPGSTATAMIAEWFLDKHPGSRIVHNLICSKAVPEIVRRSGGEPIRTKVGHSFIKQVMAESNAVFGGEHSGHYYFRDNFRADSGIMAMLVLLRVVSDAGQPLSRLRAPYEPYAQSGEINFEVDDVTATTEAVAGAFPEAATDRLDGLTVDFGDRWFNVRPSNTEPVLRLNVEAPDAGAVRTLVQQVGAIIEEAG